jgi:hypothetical protein
MPPCSLLRVGKNALFPTIRRLLGCMPEVACSMSTLQYGIICPSFQMGLSLKTDTLKLTATVTYLDILYSVGLRAT